MMVFVFTGKIILSPVLMNDGQVALAYITDAYMSMGLFKGRVPSPCKLCRTFY